MVRKQACSIEFQNYLFWPRLTPRLIKELILLNLRLIVINFSDQFAPLVIMRADIVSSPMKWALYSYAFQFLFKINKPAVNFFLNYSLA